MEQIKSLYRIVLLPLLGGAMLAACEKDNGEETRVSEFGPVQKEYVTDWKSGTGSVSVLSNQPYDIALIDPDNGWLEIDTEGRGTHFTGDDKFGIRFDTNDGFPRMEGIRLWTRDRADTVYIKQEGFTNPELNFSTRSITVLGDGGQATAQLTTNLELEDLQQQIVYTSDDEGGWIRDLDISNGFLILQTDPNSDPEALRNARITLSYRDGWNRTTSSTVYITQANAKNEFGREISFGEVRDMPGVVNRDIFIKTAVKSTSAIFANQDLLVGSDIEGLKGYVISKDNSVHLLLSLKKQQAENDVEGIITIRNNYVLKAKKEPASTSESPTP